LGLRGRVDECAPAKVRRRKQGGEGVEDSENPGVSGRPRHEGGYATTNLPNPLIMTNYLRVKHGKIVTLFVVKNTDPTY
jgi:hypothetical protein